MACVPRGCGCSFSSSTLSIEVVDGVVVIEQAEISDLTELIDRVTDLETGLAALTTSVDEDVATLTAAIAALSALVPTASGTWTSPIASGITIGTGSVFANYVRIGPLVICQFRFIQGGSGGVTGDVTLNLPIAPKSSAASTVFGGGWSNDVSVNGRYELFVGNTSSTTVTVRLGNPATTQLAVSGAPTTLAPTVPFTWATGDQLGVTFAYLAA